MKGKVIIDTSAWIDYFQSSKRGLSDRVDEILRNCDVYAPKVVIAELIQGAHSKKELSIIESFMDAFHVLEESRETWLKAGRLSFSLKKKGRTINLTDCYIAVIAMEQNCTIFTLGKHFKEIQKNSKLRFLQSK